MVVSLLPDDRHHYGEALLRTIEFLTEERTATPVVGSGFGEHSFKYRIERIMNHDFPQSCSVWVRTVVMLAGMAVLPFAIVATASTVPNVSQDEPATEAESAQQPRTPDSNKTADSPASGKTTTEKFTPVALARDEPHKLDAIDQVDFSRDGSSLFVAGHRTGDLYLLGRKPATNWIEHWDFAARKKLTTLRNLAAPFAIDRKAELIVALAAETANKGMYRVRASKIAAYNLKNQKITRLFDVAAGYASGIALAPDGQSFVSSASQYSRNSSSWINAHVIATNIEGNKQWEHNWDSSRFPNIDWSQDASMVYGAGLGVVAWNAKSGAVVWEHNDQPFGVESLACSNDGRYVVSASYFNPSSGFGVFGRAHSVVKIRDAKNGKPIRTVKLYQAGVVRPLDLAFAPDGHSVAVALGSYNRGQHWGEVRIVDVETGETTATLLKDHPQPVTTVAYSPDGQFLATGTFDGLVKLWQIEDAAPTAVSSTLEKAIDRWILGDEFWEGVGDEIGKAIERELREKLQIESEMEWKLWEAVANFGQEIEDEKSVCLVQLMLPSDKPQRSKTIALYTPDDATPFLRLTRSFGLVASPTASVSIVSPSDTSQLASEETLLIWKEARWVEVERDEIKEVVE